MSLGTWIMCGLAAASVFTGVPRMEYLLKVRNSEEH